MQILSLRKIHLLPLMKNSHTFIFHTGSCQERCPSQICVGFFQFPQCLSTQTHLQKNYFSKISPSLPSHISNLFSPLPSPSFFLPFSDQTFAHSKKFPPFFLLSSSLSRFPFAELFRTYFQHRRCSSRQRSPKGVVGNRVKLCLLQGYPLYSPSPLLSTFCSEAHEAIQPYYHTTLYIGIKNL